MTTEPNLSTDDPFGPNDPLTPIIGDAFGLMVPPLGMRDAQTIARNARKNSNKRNRIAIFFGLLMLTIGITALSAFFAVPYLQPGANTSGSDPIPDKPKPTPAPEPKKTNGEQPESPSGMPIAAEIWNSPTSSTIGPSVVKPFPNYWIRSRASGNAYLLVQPHTGDWDVIPRTDEAGAILVTAGKQRRFPYPPPSDARAILLVVTDKPAARALGELVRRWPTFGTTDRDAFNRARLQLKASLEAYQNELLDCSPMPADPKSLVRKLPFICF